MRSTICVFAVLAASAIAADRPRVFITESGTPQVSADAPTPDGKGLSFAGGSTPQSIEVMKAFSKNCRDVVITSNREKADYVIRFDHDELNPTTAFVHGNKVAVFNRDEDLIYTTSTRFLGTAVKGACSAVKGKR